MTCPYSSCPEAILPGAARRTLTSDQVLVHERCARDCLSRLVSLAAALYTSGCCCLRYRRITCTIPPYEGGLLCNSLPSTCVILTTIITSCFSKPPWRDSRQGFYAFEDYTLIPSSYESNPFSREPIKAHGLVDQRSRSSPLDPLNDLVGRSLFSRQPPYLVVHVP